MTTYLFDGWLGLPVRLAPRSWRGPVKNQATPNLFLALSVSTYGVCRRGSQGYPH